MPILVLCFQQNCLKYAFHLTDIISINIYQRNVAKIYPIVLCTIDSLYFGSNGFLLCFFLVFNSFIDTTHSLIHLGDCKQYDFIPIDVLM